MASIKTNKGRAKLVKAHTGEKSLPPIKHMAFGKGGVDISGQPKDLSGEETKLFSEVARKEVTFSHPDDFTASYHAEIDADKDKLIDVDINEVGLIDSEGDLIAIKTFKNKGLDANTKLAFSYDAEM